MFKQIIVGVVTCLSVAVAVAQGPGEVRVWRDATGRFEIRASFVEAKHDPKTGGTVVVLRRPDGTKLPVPLKQLSSQDQLAVLRAMRAGAGGNPGFTPRPDRPSSGGSRPTGVGDRFATAWRSDPGTPVVISTGSKHKGPVNIVALGPGGRHLLTTAGFGAAMLWDMSTGRRLQTFEGHRPGHLTAAISPNGRYVLTAATDWKAILWDAASGRQLRVLGDHRREVVAVAFSPDGRQMVTGSLDKTAILWNVADGEKLQTFGGHAWGISAVAFSDDGRKLLAGGNDGTV
ncbi:MAG: hypothetical protein HQ581_13020, partial [Planctomycetes bacterium]|nr:hypothetical protein [Planctomycetota bacterium]